MPTTRSRINRMTESRRTGQTSSPSPSSSHNDTSTTTTPYSQNLEQNLIDHQIYPPLYQGQDNSDDENEPNNIGEIRRRLAATRPSLDPSTFSKAEYHQFRKANWAAKKEADVTASVFPFIEGTNGTTSSSRQQYVSRDTRFTNLAPLTDGTISQAKPDISYGARPEQLDREIRNQLSDRVIPSANDRLSLAPNFRVEVKGPGGAPRVAVRQACYYGALGVRAMDALQSYEPARDQQGSQQQSLGPELRSVSDNNAYAVTATYSSGILNLYTSHSTMSTTTPNQDVSQRRPEYIMTPLRSFALINGVESFCAGAAAYRNARDWTGEVRDGAIARANGRLTEARASRARGRGGEPGLDSVIEQEEEGEAEGEEVDPFSGTRLN
ncbi:hypothetical protein BDW59DRAFT_142261 [Aspergillus cavernicola]|uniref:Uncharacterized protein n=1 Tax=Aspergillus cavernicola TaxID=176166 RepID=A0ABR4IN65_9EURO